MSGELDRLGTIVVIRVGSGSEGNTAQIISICDAPSFGLHVSDGSTGHWRQDLTRPATPDEVVQYWKTRAENAIELNDKLVELNSKLQDQNTTLVEKLLAEKLKARLEET